tara:strand:+ start:61 stop:525 length:465 start_codon:yes stop_codon:yes gene_type:complete
MSTVKLNKLLDDSDMPVDGKLCIYSLFDNGVCVYVGQSSKIKNRIYWHLSDGKTFNEIAFEYCNNPCSNEAEAAMIVKMNPTLNKVLPPTNKYISLTAMSSQITDLLFKNKEKIAFSFSGAAHKNPKLTKRYISTESAEKIKLSILNIIALGED